MKIYTKQGDQGMTDLLSGGRQLKDNPFIILNGHMDELTSHLGLVKVVGDQDVVDRLNTLQKRLIEIMGFISSEFSNVKGLQEDIEALEHDIDEFSTLYPKQNSFIIPGSCEVAGRLDVARTVARRAERSVVSLSQVAEVPKEIEVYINRLSDYLFSMARMLEFREEVKKMINLKELKDHQYTHTNILLKDPVLNLELAKKIAEFTENEAINRGCQVVICLTSKAGLPQLIHQMDDAFPISFDLARKKAYTSAVLKMPTHELGKLTAPGGDFEGLEDMIDEEIVTLGGGYPIIYKNEIIGAIGVSGSTVNNDIELAKIGSECIGRTDV